MALLTVILPVFALILVGVVARRGGMVDAAGFRGVTDLVFFVAMPALIFGAILRGQATGLLGVAAVYFAGCLLVYALALLAARLLRLPLAHGAMLGLNASYGNTVMMGIPIATAALGAAALPPLMAIIALHSAILLPLTSLLIEAGGAARQRPLALLRKAVAGVVRNPVIMAMPAAFAWRGLGLPVPEAMAETLRLLGAASVPLALICLGGALPAPRRDAIGAEAGIGTLLKLAVQPAVIWAIGSWAGLAPLHLAVAVLTGGMPTGANAFLLARHAGDLMAISATTVVIGMVLSLASLPLLLHLIL
jgi:predicted permease